MKRSLNIRGLVCAAVSGLLFAAGTARVFASGRQAESVDPNTGIPHFVNEAILNAPDDVLIGVGSCTLSGSLPEAKIVAEERARTDIARQLEESGGPFDENILINARTVKEGYDTNNIVWVVLEAGKPRPVNRISVNGGPGPAEDTPANGGGIEGALLRAGNTIMEKLAPKTRLAIVYVTARDAEVSEFIAGELESVLVSKGFTLIDRSQLDELRKEQSLQFSGEVNDEQAVSIGKLAGANVIITGAVTGSGDLRRLRLRALSAETGQVLASPSEKY